MASIPISQRSTPNPISPKGVASPSPPVNPSSVKLLVVTPDQPISRAQRRDQILEQVEKQINRQSGDNDETEVDWKKFDLGPEAELRDWQPVRRSTAPKDLIAQDEYYRKRGWQRGKREEEFFAKRYRFDHDQMPYLKRKYETPNNSKVSDIPEWKSGNWYKGLTKRRKKDSRPADNSKVMAVQRRPHVTVTSDDINVRFLRQSHPLLGKFWKGVKVLGKGGQGIVGLWEYIGGAEHVWGRRIVIKHALSQSLTAERDMMLALNDGTGNNDHVVKLLYPTTPDAPKDSYISKLILEFCEGGDLESLIHKHRKDKEPFSEENLWLFFECFSKGLNVMDHANESPARKPDSRDPMCHFDIKPQNILRGNFDEKHKAMPVNKVADFGLASLIDPVHYEHVSRHRGTQGYLAPEQFSSRWAYKDAKTCGHINVYGTHTNTWQIGLLMYSLATLRGPPRPKGFRCAAIGKKFTYGYKLHKEKYSRALKSLIWRCLCDKPEERPSLETLDSEIAIALAAIRIIPSAAKSNQKLDPPEPRDPRASSLGRTPGVRGQTQPTDKGTKRKAPEKVVQDLPASKMSKVVKAKHGEKEDKPRQMGEPTGTRAAPFVLAGGTMMLRKNIFTFCIVPKHLPKGKQEPIWFRATPDSTLKGLKQVIRDETGLHLDFEEQFIYLRIPDKPVKLLNNEVRMLWLEGVGQDARLELWTSKEAHDAAEPEEPGFEVV